MTQPIQRGPRVPVERGSFCARLARHAALTVLVFVVAFVLSSFPGVARAEVASKKGSSVLIELPGGASAPLVLVAKDTVFSGEFDIRNAGVDPLVVSRVAVRTDDDDPRVPPKVDVRFVEGGTSATIPPGTAKHVLVTWVPERDAKMRQLFGHLIVTSNDEARGDVALGFQARARHPLRFLGDHALSILILLPLLGSLVVFTTRAAGREGLRRARAIAIGFATAAAGVAMAMAVTFRTGIVRADGNEGLQFIEHTVWIRSLGVEYFVGVDGTSIAFVLLTAVLGVITTVSARSSRLSPGFFGCLLLVFGLTTGVFVACDIVLLLAFWQATLVPLYFLVAMRGGSRRTAAALKMFVTLLVATLLVAFGALVLRQHADASYLVDGTRVSHPSSIAELGRNVFAAKTATVFGTSIVKLGTVMIFAGFLATMAAFPFHTWLVDGAVESEGPVSSLLTALVPKIGVYGMLRVAFTLLPEGTRWAAAALVGVGAITVVYAAFAALATRDLKRMASHLGVAQLGFCLLGLGSMTPEGILGALVLVVSHGLAMSLAFSLLDSLESRVGTRDVSRLGGIVVDAPVLTGIFALAVTVAVGLPGLVGFWGVLLTVLGTMPAHRIPALLALVGVALAAAAGFFAVQRAFLGPLDASWRSKPTLEPFGGKIPDLRRDELMPLVPLAVLVVALGLYPAPLLALVSGGVHDVSNTLVPPGPDQVALLPTTLQKPR